MKSKKIDGGTHHQRWAEFRFSVIGHLFASPPEKGEIKTCLRSLAEKTWQHPLSGEPFRLGMSTIERWYYKTRREQNPVEILKRKLRSDAGAMPTVEEQAKGLIIQQYKDHPSWSYQLHSDNLIAAIEIKKLNCHRPSYSTLRRFMKKNGLFRKKKSRNQQRPAAIAAFERSQKREVRLFEAPFSQSLWHLDFHHGSLQILGEDGQRHTPLCLCIVDDHSRLACHIQWYLHEDTDCLVHGFTQALQKRGLPRELMTDNGSAMKSSEFTRGLTQLSIIWSPTLEYSPNQNGKQEVFWSTLEGRLMAMLENVPDLSLKLLNDATIAWVEMEYNRSVHSETKESPINRLLYGKDVSRSCPDTETLVDAFMHEVHRQQRRSDGTIQLEGNRYEIPSRYRHMETIYLCYARWDLSRVFIIDPKTRKKVARIFPVDLTKNAESSRRSIETDIFRVADRNSRSKEIAPLLQKLMAEYAATGMPPAYIPKTVRQDEEQ